MFIASSSEGLGVAHDVQELLEHDCHATVWNQGVFAPSDAVLQRLVTALPQHEFALFVFTPDDRLQIRGAEVSVVRDNVVFEMGLFVGAVGAERCFHLVPRGSQSLRLPSDLLGLLALDFPADRPDRNRLAALGPACNKLRRALRERRGARPVLAAERTSADVLARYLAAWTSPPLSDDRARLRAGIPFDACDDEFPRDALWRVFNFLDSLAHAVLAGEMAETAARANFGQALISFWPSASQLLAPPNHVDEVWDPPPRIAELYGRWK